MVIFGALGLLLVGGGGAGAFMMLSGGEPSADGEPQEIAAPSEPIYLRLEGLTAPVIRANRIRHYVFLNVTLEMATTAARDEAVKLKPRLHDAFLRDFYSKSVTDKDGSGRLDFEAIQRRLVKQAKGVLGDDQVLNALVTRAVRGAG
jgi:flagellar basal body-associated protein FliL